jgi:transcriptional regulator with XRE-family HTH domain
MLKERLKELRSEKQITQRELANLLRLSPSTIAMYETGQRMPDPEILQRIADFFGVSTDYLLGRTDIPNPYIPEEYTQKHKVAKRDLMQYEDFIKQAGIFFMNDEVAEEDKEKLFRDISELFWKAKEMNKKKYGRKKAKTDQ